MSLIFVIYTHSSYQDVFDISIKRHEKFSNIFNKIILSNLIMNYKYQHILYNDNEPYATRLYNCLCKLSNSFEYILLSHDWAILYDYIDKNKINNVIEIMKKHDIHQLRLWRNGISNKTFEKLLNNNIETNVDEKYIYHIPDESYFYTVQPTIWNINILKNILYNHLQLTYNQIEVGVNDYIKQFNNCFYYINEDKFLNSEYFYKSIIYPHIHAMSNGKWIYNDNLPYSKELIDEYNIDINIRNFI